MNKTFRIIINVVIFLLVAGFIWYMTRSMNREERKYAEPQRTDSVAAPYQQISTIELPQAINRFELYGGKLFVASGQSVYIYDGVSGQTFSSFPVGEPVRDIAVEGEDIYILYPASVEVYTSRGVLSRRWEACSELSDYCSLAVTGGFVFVTDAENKNICQYGTEGNFVKFIQSPKGFVIPSYSFDIVGRNDTLYVANSGRHLIESYTLAGNFISSFGSAGADAGSFAGCCNPAYITFSPGGDLITSEKGNPRITLFDGSGRFKEVLFNNRLLGGGTKAYEVKTAGKQLFIGGKEKIAIYAYDGERE